jgi:hypothetical protein
VGPAIIISEITPDFKRPRAPPSATRTEYSPREPTLLVLRIYGTPHPYRPTDPHAAGIMGALSAPLLMSQVW